MTAVTITQIILVMLLWAACFPLITAGLDLAPHLTFAAMRALLAGLTLTMLALALHRPLPRGLPHWVMLAWERRAWASWGCFMLRSSSRPASPR